MYRAYQSQFYNDGTKYQLTDQYYNTWNNNITCIILFIHKNHLPTLYYTMRYRKTCMWVCTYRYILKTYTDCDVIVAKCVYLYLVQEL